MTQYLVRRGTLALALLALGPMTFAQSLTDPSLEAVPVLSGLNQPIGLAFTGSNECLLIEKASGQVKRFVNGVAAGVVLDLAVNSASERGLLGIALHPNFPAYPRVYLFWTESSTGADTVNASAVSLLGNRVDSFVWNGSSLAFDKNLMTLRSLQEDAGQPVRGNHNGGVIRFGPDGKLYVIMGDNGRRGWTQNNRSGPNPDDQFGGPFPDAAHTTGAVFRINDDGTTPADNPFVGLVGPSFDRVWMYGVRNGFGMAFDPMSGNLWTQENGDDTFDEMNRVTKGMNGGWIQTMGPLSRVAEFKAIETARAGGLQQLRWPPTRIAETPALAWRRMWHAPGSLYRDPEFSWKYAVAPAGINFVAGLGLGPDYFGDMLVGAARTNLANGYLFRFKMSPDRTRFSFTDTRLSDLVADNLDKFSPVESETLQIGSGFGVVTAIENAPNGNVWLVSLDQGRVLELRKKAGFRNGAKAGRE